ncbi:Hypothetical protein ADU72_0012 (plasmid) [Pediococcus damnosus]|uniref:Uncharacterized protein n=1 Tax=Pediococcus damnosus TaxID=51663 RepID=A0AAC9FJR8_9LACO|nr:Hypothetical protein ADU70_0273 [Pediococcus damnosus]AMV68168.1 Hypothetical protein ADU72_0012 [Pediococcus damnosus]
MELMEQGTSNVDMEGLLMFHKSEKHGTGMKKSWNRIF